MLGITGDILYKYSRYIRLYISRYIYDNLSLEQGIYSHHCGSGVTLSWGLKMDTRAIKNINLVNISILGKMFLIWEYYMV